MHYQQFGTTYVIVLDEGEEVVQTLTNFAKIHQIKNASITGLGAVREICVGYYELSNKQYHWQTFKGNLEITGLTGNIALLETEPFLHIHTSFSDERFIVHGGHLKTAIVGVTLEVKIEQLREEITRIFNDEIGLNLIKLPSE